MGEEADSRLQSMSLKAMPSAVSQARVAAHRFAARRIAVAPVRARFVATLKHVLGVDNRREAVRRSAKLSSWVFAVAACFVSPC